MQRIPHREYLAWAEHKRLELNRPDRSDYYLMQVAAEIEVIRAILLRKDSVRIKISDKSIDFKEEKPVPATKEEAIKEARSKWAFLINKIKRMREKRGGRGD